MAIWDEISYVTVFFKAFLTPLVPLSIDFNGRKNEIFGFREAAKNTLRGDAEVFTSNHSSIRQRSLLASEAPLISLRP